MNTVSPSNQLETKLFPSILTAPSNPAYAIVLNFNSSHHEKILKLQVQLGGEQSVPAPHITLALCREISLGSSDLEEMGKDLKQLVSKTNSFSLNFPEVGTFPTGGAIFLAPQATD